MKKKMLTGLLISCMVLSTGTSVFAAETKDGTVPVEGNVQKYIPKDEINVELPTSMVFNIGFNTDTQEAQLQSADYSITNKGEKPLDVTVKYTVTDSNNITLTSPEKVDPNAENLQLALSLNKGDGTAWIQNIENGATGNAITLNDGASEDMKFSASQQGLANITQHDKDGKIKENISTDGKLVFTFNLQEKKQEEHWQGVNELTINSTFNNSNITVRNSPFLRKNNLFFSDTTSHFNKITYKINDGDFSELILSSYPRGCYGNLAVNFGDIITLKVKQAPIDGAYFNDGCIKLKINDDSSLSILMNN